MLLLLLRDLHWLRPPTPRLALAVLAFRCLRAYYAPAPPWLACEQRTEADIDPRRRLHSSSTSTLVVTSTRHATTGDRALSPVFTSRVDGPCWRVMETGHPSTRAVNSGSGNRALPSPMYAHGTVQSTVRHRLIDITACLQATAEDVAIQTNANCDVLTAA